MQRLTMLTDMVGYCSICKQPVISSSQGYIEFYEHEGQVLHDKCVDKGQNNGELSRKTNK